MNRVIKFRMWDKNSHKMRKVESIAFGELSPSLEGYPVVNGVGYDCIHDKNIMVHRDLPDFELMQYTGIEDMNLNEIYEGDIVTILDRNADDDEHFVVKYNDSDAIYELEGETYIWNFTDIYGYQCEVIGNIYENPELLKESGEQ